MYMHTYTSKEEKVFSFKYKRQSISPSSIHKSQHGK